MDGSDGQPVAVAGDEPQSAAIEVEQHTAELGELGVAADGEPDGRQRVSEVGAEDGQCGHQFLLLV